MLRELDEARRRNVKANTKLQMLVGMAISRHVTTENLWREELWKKKASEKKNKIRLKKEKKIALEKTLASFRYRFHVVAASDRIRSIGTHRIATASRNKTNCKAITDTVYPFNL